MGVRLTRVTAPFATNVPSKPEALVGHPFDLHA